MTFYPIYADPDHTHLIHYGFEMENGDMWGALRYEGKVSISSWGKVKLELSKEIMQACELWGRNLMDLPLYEFLNKTLNP